MQTTSIPRIKELKFYSLKDKIKPFFRGLVKGEPLVEVARDGLDRNGKDRRLDETLGIRYELKASGVTSRQLYKEINANELTDKTQMEKCFHFRVLEEQGRINRVLTILGAVVPASLLSSIILAGSGITSSLVALAGGLGASFLAMAYDVFKTRRGVTMASQLLTNDRVKSVCGRTNLVEVVQKHGSTFLSL